MWRHVLFWQTVSVKNFKKRLYIIYILNKIWILNFIPSASIPLQPQQVRCPTDFSSHGAMSIYSSLVIKLMKTYYIINY